VGIVRRGADTILYEHSMSRTALALSLVGAALFLSSSEAGTAFQVVSDPSSLEIPLVGENGNQIILRGDDSPKLLSSFSFDYESNYTMKAGLVVRFYKNDGGQGSPGTLIYQSDPFDIKLGREQVSISYNSTPVPKEFTYTVEFRGNDDNNNNAGLLTPNVIPAVGQSYDDIWLRNTGGWQLRHVVGSFSMLTATVTVNDGPGLVISSPAVNQIKVSWQDSTYKLQGRDAAAGGGTWTDVPGITGTSVTLPVTGSLGFFRLITR